MAGDIDLHLHRGQGQAYAQRTSSQLGLSSTVPHHTSLQAFTWTDLPTMPPSRIVPPAKAIKTERTHAENQERAYIAASRRSDRSLEGRVESARRAAEIHKRRTGRTLRVTEQDVINEETYEEEDDNFLMQYRRLTAHLQTGSADLNQRLAAYLTNQVAMRSAVEQIANNPYGQQYNNHAMPYNQYRQNIFQSPMLQQRHPMPQSATTPGSYRKAPYPSTHHPGFRHNHGRAYSTGVMLSGKVETPPTPSNPIDHRRMSTPATIPPQIDTNSLKSDPVYMRQIQSALPQAPYNPFWQDKSLFTISLPPESQQMFAGTPSMDPDDPFSAALMHGSEQLMAHPYYPWEDDTQQSIKGIPVHPTAYQGMPATLASAALTIQAGSLSATPSSTQPTTLDGSVSVSGLDPLSLNDYSVVGKESYSPHSPVSGQSTPGESLWSNFVHDGGWGDEMAASN